MTPLDRAAATVEGTSLWIVKMRPWGEQIDELVDAGSYAEALTLLDSTDKVLLPDKVRGLISSLSLYLNPFGLVG